MQLSLFSTDKDPPSIIIEDLFQAYMDCRRNKRNNANAIAFEVDYESNLVALCAEINNGTYQPGRSIVFILHQPVMREIFAADFKDRIVHHLIINKLNPLFEKEFIYDSSSCRMNKGTHFAVQRLNRFILQCSQNYTEDCYILKLDIKGFFMHINKNILFRKLAFFINEKYKGQDKALVINLCQKVIFNNPTLNCVIKGKRGDWQGLPSDKSLFHSPPNCGLPIGNLTSQIFANFYMNCFDHYIKHDLKVRFYNRYVDDFVITSCDKEYLKSLTHKIRKYLRLELQLILHPRKIYLQHYTKGVKYLGAIIKPNRIYIANRTKGNFCQAITKINGIFKSKGINKQKLSQILASTNSYLGLMRQYKTYKLRRKLLMNQFAPVFWKFFKLVKNKDEYLKIVLRK